MFEQPVTRSMSAAYLNSESMPVSELERAVRATLLGVRPSGKVVETERSAFVDFTP